MHFSSSSVSTLHNFDIDAAIESFKNALVLEPNDAGIKKELAAAKKKGECISKLSKHEVFKVRIMVKLQQLHHPYHADLKLQSAKQKEIAESEKEVSNRIRNLYKKEYAKKQSRQVALLVKKLGSSKMIGLWRIIIAHNLPYTDARRTGKISKLLLHRLVPNARCSIWVDGKLKLKKIQADRMEPDK
ncbi:hypothetical protein HN51_040621 [Arachis hypogaea]